MAQSSTGTATPPKRVMTERALGCRPPPKIAAVTRTSPSAKTTKMAAEIGRSTDAEERDVGSQVVAAHGDGHERRRGERPAHGPVRRRPPASPPPCAGSRGPLLRTRLPPQPDQPVHPDGQRHQPEQSHHFCRELEEDGGRRSGHDDEDHEAHHLARRDAARPVQRRTRHHRHGHQAVVDVGPDEGRRGDAEVGSEAGRGHQGRDQVADGSGMAGPNGLSPRKVTRWAKRAASP